MINILKTQNKMSWAKKVMNKCLRVPVFLKKHNNMIQQTNEREAMSSKAK